MDAKNSILLTEFYSATGYLERILFAYTELSKSHLLPNGKLPLFNILKSQHELYTRHFSNNSGELEFEKFSFEDNIKNIKQYNFFVENLIKLPFTNKNNTTFIIDFINAIYLACYGLHRELSFNKHFEIQYPRNCIASESDINGFPFFSVDLKEATDLISKSSDNLHFLNFKRNEKYESNLHLAHKFISEKNYQEANQYFFKALNYQETAEVLTLIAWTFSLQNDFESAKKYALKAIDQDSNYGPAYNDYGNYLLSEGKIVDSIKWFEKAKRALNYQNREYPYINAGRAYVLLHQYNKALNEFSLALTICPHNEELHHTVMRLKMNLKPTSSEEFHEKN